MLKLYQIRSLALTALLCLGTASLLVFNAPLLQIAILSFVFAVDELPTLFSELQSKRFFDGRLFSRHIFAANCVFLFFSFWRPSKKRGKETFQDFVVWNVKDNKLWGFRCLLCGRWFGFILNHFFLLKWALSKNSDEIIFKNHLFFEKMLSSLFLESAHLRRKKW